MLAFKYPRRTQMESYTYGAIYLLLWPNGASALVFRLSNHVLMAKKWALLEGVWYVKRSKNF